MIKSKGQFQWFEGYFYTVSRDGNGSLQSSYIPYTIEFWVLQETADSIVEPNPRLKEKVHVAWIPRIPLKEPKKPMLYLPRLPPSLTERRPRQSPSSYQRADQKRELLRQKVLIIQIRNEGRYRYRMAQYLKRLQKYKENLAAATYGIMSYRKHLSQCRPLRQQHPYSRVRVITVPWTGFSRVDALDRKVINGLSYPIPGSYGVQFQIQAGVLQSYWGVSDPPLDLLLEVEPLALSKATDVAHARLRNRRDEQIAHVGNILAERHKSLSMLKSLLQRFFAVLSKGGPRKLSGMISGSKGRGSRLDDDFLMFQFGLRPLMTDIWSIVKELDSQERDSMILTIRASGINVQNAKTSSTGQFNIVSESQITCRAQVRYVLNYRIDNAVYASLQSYGFANPLEIAWEMMPWSFVVDWLYPIGEWIRANSNARNLTFLSGTMATTLLTTHHIHLSALDELTGGAFAEKITCKIDGAWSRETKQRVLLTEPPNVNIPKFRSPISFYHILETIALITQRFR